jgi:hypothetical protein
MTPPVGKFPGGVDVTPAVVKSPARAEKASTQVKAIADRNRFMSCLLKFRVDDARFLTSSEIQQYPAALGKVIGGG